MDADTTGMKWPAVSCQEVEEWGLTAAKLAEVKAELDDHVYCVEGSAGKDAAADAKAQLETPVTRRKLVGVHVTDQVVATLNRLPSRREWHELAWLGLWYLLIMLSDQAAIWAGDLANDIGLKSYGHWVSILTKVPSESVNGDAFIPWATAAWLLQGIARAGFFASFGYSLWRAHKIGWGVLLARLLQLKLIHTVLVLIGCAILGNQLWRNSYQPTACSTDWPLWLGAGYISAILIAIAIVLFTKPRHRMLATGMVLAAFFLYPGGPADIDVLNVQRPIATKAEVRDDGNLYLIAETDPDVIRAAAEKSRFNRNGAVKDVENNLVYYSYENPAPMLGSFWAAKEYDSWGLQQSQYFLGFDTGTRVLSRPDLYEAIDRTFLAAPVAVPGAGLGWLAAPIPILGIIGLVAMVFLMGRRSLLHTLLYSIICIAAIVSTILPFMMVGITQPYSGLTGGLLFGMYDVSPAGVVISPCPSFEMLLAGSALAESWTVVLGLLLSAAAPWLLTGLFLKQKSTMPDRDDIALVE